MEHAANKFVIKKYILRKSFLTNEATILQHSEKTSVQGVSNRALQIWKLIEIYTEDIHKVLNCQNVAKHTEFYLG